VTTHFKFATTDDDFKNIGILYREYFDFIISLGFNIGDDPGFGVFINEELTGRSARFMPPKGYQMLLYDDEKLAGCVAFNEFKKDICEIHRLYVRPTFRGLGLGKKLLLAVLDHAKQLGYTKAYLDSNVKLERAIQIYPALGFKQIPAYHPDPTEGMLYFEKTL
jgi:N-acetylglutamate synthase-like GNAT family acetyltransferase